MTSSPYRKAKPHENVVKSISLICLLRDDSNLVDTLVHSQRMEESSPRCGKWRDQRFLKSSHSKSYQHVAKTSLFYNDPDQLPWELCRQSYITPGKNGSGLETKKKKKAFRNQISQSAANLAWWFLNMGLLWLGNRFSLGVPPWKST